MRIVPEFDDDKCDFASGYLVYYRPTPTRWRDIFDIKEYAGKYLGR